MWKVHLQGKLLGEELLTHRAHAFVMLMGTAGVSPWRIVDLYSRQQRVGILISLQPRQSCEFSPVWWVRNVSYYE